MYESCPACGDPDTEKTPLGLWCYSCGDYGPIDNRQMLGAIRRWT